MRTSNLLAAGVVSALVATSLSIISPASAAVSQQPCADQLQFEVSIGPTRICYGGFGEYQFNKVGVYKIEAGAYAGSLKIGGETVTFKPGQVKNFNPPVNPTLIKLQRVKAPKPQYDEASSDLTLTDPDDGDMSLGLPGVHTSEAPSAAVVQKAAEVDAGDLLGVTKLASSTVSSFGSESTFQSLIEIEGPTAPTRYAFPMDIPADADVTIEKDGSVSILDANGEDLGGVAEPWALDANGKELPTHFVLQGNKLVQVIEHGSGTAYPVIADPRGFWGWVACVGAVAATVAYNSNLALKVARVVRRFGSIKRTMQIAYRAYKQARGAAKRDAVIAAIGNVGAELLGIYEIKDKCFS